MGDKDIDITGGDLGAIKDAIMTQLKAQIPELNAFAYDTDSPRPYPNITFEPTPPLDYELTLGMGNSFKIELPAHLEIQKGSSPEAWRSLDEFRSPTGAKSIKAAIWTDRTLGSAVDDCTVKSSANAARNRDSDDKIWVFSCRFIFKVIKTLAPTTPTS